MSPRASPVHKLAALRANVKPPPLPPMPLFCNGTNNSSAVPSAPASKESSTLTSARSTLPTVAFWPLPNRSSNDSAKPWRRSPHSLLPRRSTRTPGPSRPSPMRLWRRPCPLSSLTTASSVRRQPTPLLMPSLPTSIVHPPRLSCPRRLQLPRTKVRLMRPSPIRCQRLPRPSAV